jgi:hypothetical protein
MTSLPVVVTDDEAGAIVFDVPRRRKSARMIDHAADLCADDRGDQIGEVGKRKPAVVRGGTAVRSNRGNGLCMSGCRPLWRGAGASTCDAQRILWLLESNLRRLEEHRDRLRASVQQESDAPLVPAQMKSPRI